MRNSFVLLVLLLLLPAGLMAGGVPEDYADAALNSTERVDLARAYLGLFEDGFPGPDLAAISPGLAVVPLVLLGSADKDSGEATGELHLQACLFAARYDRYYRLARPEGCAGTADLDVEVRHLGEFVQECQEVAGKVRRNSPLYCLAAPILSATDSLGRRDAVDLTSRCSPDAALIAALEKTVGHGKHDRAELSDAMELALALEGNWFERRYVEALVQEVGRFVATAEQVARCEKKRGCDDCRKAARALLDAGREEEAGRILSLMQEQEGEAGCLKDALILIAWHQDWRKLEVGAEKLPVPPPDWYLRLDLYRLLLAIAAGQGDPVAAQALIDKSYGGSKRHCLFTLVLQTLRRTAEVFAEEEQLAFLDGFLTGSAVRDCATLHRVALEILFMALESGSTDRLMQSLVLLDRAWDSCREEPELRDDLEAFRQVARWADRNWAGDTPKAQVSLKNSSRALLTTIVGSSRRTRSMVLLNLLASTVLSRHTVMPDMKAFLSRVEVRSVPYYVAWLYYYLHKRQTARAYAISRLCEKVASAGMERGICALWQASIHDLAGRHSAAGEALAQARREMGDRYEDARGGGAVLVLQGERRVRVVLDREGELHIDSGQSPLAVLVLLPRPGKH